MRDYSTLIPAAPLIYRLGEERNNEIYIMRDDLIPFSFGGNKARKAALFAAKAAQSSCDCFVTYGSAGSNHCRVIANIAAAEGMGCTIVSPESDGEAAFSRLITKEFGARVIEAPLDRISETIDSAVSELKKSGFNPYFIAGGGHGNVGTQAYFDAFAGIDAYGKANGIRFDSIFHASGTGTTQAGLICGAMACGSDTKIIGISIARSKQRGADVVVRSVTDFCGCDEHLAREKVIFEDDYTCGGYGKYDKSVTDTIDRVMRMYGVPLDPTYTGKAFAGMNSYIKANGIQGQRILFIHTGGTPIYFDYLRSV